MRMLQRWFLGGAEKCCAERVWRELLIKDDNLQLVDGQCFMSFFVARCFLKMFLFRF